jgi:hypothetical protein
MKNEIPRRNRLDLNTSEEIAIYDVMQKIEQLGTHELLTECVIKLSEAREKLADWVDKDISPLN